MNKSKVVVVANAALGKIASIIGYTLGSFFLLGIIATISGDMEDPVASIIICLFLLVFSIFLIIKGSQIKRRIRRFKRYVSLISTQQMTSLENLAASTSQSVDFVRNDLKMMINKSFFANASIDMAANEIVIGGSRSQTATQTQGFGQQAELGTYNCTGCGASGTKIKGVPGSCDYCGSAVK